MQNFGKIKNVFNNLFVEGILKKDDTSKELFKKYLKTIKKSEILKTQFLIYNNIENRIDEDVISANLFISENVRLLEKYNASDILKENQRLLNLLTQSNNKLIDQYEHSELHESLTNVIFTKRTPKNITQITEGIKKISNYILSNKPKEINEAFDLPVSVLANLMVEKYNEKYDSLNQIDKKILKTLIESDNKGKKEFHDEIVQECLTLVEKLLDSADEESKEKLTKVKLKLNTKEDISENDLLDRIFKLIELKQNLI